MRLVPALAIAALIGADPLLSGCGSSGASPSSSHRGLGGGVSAPATTSAVPSSARKSTSTKQKTPTTATPNPPARNGGALGGTAGRVGAPGGTAGRAGTNGGGKAIGTNGGGKVIGPTRAQIEKLLKQSSASECNLIAAAAPHVSAQQRAELERLCAKVH